MRLVRSRCVAEWLATNGSPAQSIVAGAADVLAMTERCTMDATRSVSEQLSFLERPAAAVKSASLLGLAADRLHRRSAAAGKRLRIFGWQRKAWKEHGDSELGRQLQC